MISAFTNGLSDLLRTLTSALLYPVIVILLLLAVLVLVQLGRLIAEYFTDHRRLQETLPDMVDRIHLSGNLTECISESKLLNSQKEALLELLKHPMLPETDLVALAKAQLEQQEDAYLNVVKKTDLIAKLGPMFGLLGTLIPLGPGIIALGRGDTLTLSSSLLTAFDTTVLGLVVAAIAMVISAVRRKWYKRYMDMLRALTECLMEAILES